MAEPAWQEQLRVGLVERNARESAYASVIEQYRRLAQQTKLLKERNASLLRAMGSARANPSSSTVYVPGSGDDNPVRAAYITSLESQISSLRDELATVYKTQGQNAQRLLAMNETLREKEELSRLDSESLRKARDEIATLRRKVEQHNELMAEKDRTAQILHDEINTLQLELGQIEERNSVLTKDNAKLLQRWLDAKQAEVNKMNEAMEFYEDMQTRRQAAISTNPDAPNPGPSAADTDDVLSLSESMSGNGEGLEEPVPTTTKNGITSPAETDVSQTPNGYDSLTTMRTPSLAACAVFVAAFGSSLVGAAPALSLGHYNRLDSSAETISGGLSSLKAARAAPAVGQYANDIVTSGRHPLVTTGTVVPSQPKQARAPADAPGVLDVLQARTLPRKAVVGTVVARPAGNSTSPGAARLSKRALDEDTAGGNAYSGAAGDVSGGSVVSATHAVHARTDDRGTMGGNAYTGDSGDVSGGSIENIGGDNAGMPTLMNINSNNAGAGGTSESGCAAGGHDENDAGAGGNASGAGGNAYSGSAGNAEGGSVSNVGGMVNYDSNNGGAAGTSKTGCATGGNVGAPTTETACAVCL
ncbi:ATG16-domain-containing protein [Wolfiporia cocos MD-104 SS10]|uniref:ATG16-domain-containing protein n=1 Tax=Wolfiporia cocos (strain MD-104) TaxID=742152 RepID=A0A2H3IUU6_WOLCO|nr:ATG16-domain-containing protein [Wolfiporia cocos MD-104 SS10]